LDPFYAFGESWRSLAWRRVLPCWFPNARCGVAISAADERLRASGGIRRFPSDVGLGQWAVRRGNHPRATISCEFS